MKQNPFSLYDFLGYFIPGAALIYLVYIIGIIKLNNDFDLQIILASLPSIKTESIILFLIISYILGHMISYVSSITVETYANWKYGYPSKYLLNMRNSKETNYWTGAKCFHSIFWRSILIVILIPSVLLDYVLGRWFGFKNFYYKKLDSFLIEIIIDKANSLIKKLVPNLISSFDNGCANDSDFFRIIMHYTFENSKNHQSKLSNYVALYGFLRTITFLFNGLFWYLILHNIIYSKFNITIITIILITGIISYVFFMAFMKFYRRYTLEGLMILAVDTELQ